MILLNEYLHDMIEACHRDRNNAFTLTPTILL